MNSVMFEGEIFQTCVHHTDMSKAQTKTLTSCKAVNPTIAKFSSVRQKIGSPFLK